MRRIKFFSGYIGGNSSDEKMENEIHEWLDSRGYHLVTVKLTDNEENGMVTIAVVYDTGELRE